MTEEVTMKGIIILFWGLFSLYTNGFAQDQYWDISYGKDVIGPESAPLTMAIFNDALHIGGQFRRLNSNTQNILQTGYVASWKNGIWNGLNGGMNAPLNALCVGPDKLLYASGSFTRCNDGQLQGIASWNGSNWLALKGISAGNINVLMSHENVLYAAGIFDTIGNRPAASIARLVQGEWIPLGNGLKRIDANNTIALPHVNALSSFNGKLFVGGDFDSAGNTKARNIAYWDGKEWHGMGEGIQGEVDAITVLSNGNVIVASTIKMGTAIFPSPLMSWNGSS